MPKILIKRLLFHSKLGMIGELKLYKNGKEVFTCNTCENFNVGEARNSDLAIPCGVYKSRTHLSNKFRWKLGTTSLREHLLLFNDQVPEDRYILIHAGNSHKDTEGCILVGDFRGDSFINSKIALQNLHKHLFSLVNYKFRPCEVIIENCLIKG